VITHPDHQVDTIGDAYIVVAFLEDWSDPPVTNYKTSVQGSSSWNASARSFAFGQSAKKRIAPSHFTNSTSSMTFDADDADYSMTQDAGDQRMDADIQSCGRGVSDVAGLPETPPTDGACVCVCACEYVWTLRVRVCAWVQV